MRSRAARLTLSITAWAGLGAAAFFLVNTEQQLAQRRAALRAFDADARKATDALADARGGQQAYVAAGQDAGHWIPQVAELTQQASASIDSLRATAASDSAGKSLLDSSQALAEFANVDKQVRDYLRTGENLMASDVVFNEADDVASRAASGVEAAVAGEQERIRRLRIPAPHVGSVCARRRGRMVRAGDGDSCVRRGRSAAGIRHGRRGIDYRTRRTATRAARSHAAADRTSMRLHRPPRLRLR